MDLFTREDWTLFRNLGTLGQKAGVGVEDIPKLIAKELVDNALDSTGACHVSLIHDATRQSFTGFRITDDGHGIPGTPEEIADIFSIARPLLTSKLLRLPTRGALGNGLRVVAGAVLASGGSLEVKTQGQVLRLSPKDDGKTDVEIAGKCDHRGTVINVSFGPVLQVGSDSLDWAIRATMLAKGEDYKGKTSPFWYDSDALFELTQAAGPRPIRDLIASFDGCSGKKASLIAGDFLGRPANSLTREEAEILLLAARNHAKPVRPARLGKVGRPDHVAGYSIVTGEYTPQTTRGNVRAIIPYVIEAWVALAEEKGNNIIFEGNVNKTPITTEIKAYYSKGDLILIGCGLNHSFKNIGRRSPSRVGLNILTPYMPITTDGKSPDLTPFVQEIYQAVTKAIAQAKRDRRNTGYKVRTMKDIIFELVDLKRDELGKGGRYRFSQRQLFYAVRPAIIEETGKEPDYDHFAKVITSFENLYGDIQGMYRDSRGTLYHPHIREDIPLGTMEVEHYSRPDWTFNKILYIEKEGLFAILKAEYWPERHDCALLTSKGQATRAAKDLLDLLGDTSEELVFYCIHDADAPGTMIYQALQEGTSSRPGRRVKIVNLGLEPWEAVIMGLQIEKTSYKAKQPVGDYIAGDRPREEEREKESFPFTFLDRDWSSWLQKNRVELNAMSTELFLSWLDAKMEDSRKVIPPGNVLQDRLYEDVEEQVRKEHTDRILKEAGLDHLVNSEMISLSEALYFPGRDLKHKVMGELQSKPVESWKDPIARLAKEIVEKHLDQDGLP